MKRLLFNLVIVLILGLFLLLGLVDYLGGAFRYEPEQMTSHLSSDAKQFLNSTLSDLNGTRIDYHTHIVGVGYGGTGAMLNPSFTSWVNPVKAFKTSIYRSGCGVSELAKTDGEFFSRLQRLVNHRDHESTHYLLAFDHYYNLDGSVNLTKSEFYIPNDYVYRLSQTDPKKFKAAISIHPYRKDALERLTYWAEQGVRLVKWLPNAQGIDASSPRLDPYYQILKQYNMLLLTHVGEERAVESIEDQVYGNPLRFRRPLDQGVKVIMAHSASLGKNLDLDNPTKQHVDSFTLFMRLMEEPAYQGLLFAEVSAMTQINRLPGPLQTLLAREDLHDRIVDGSDYPLPALNIVISTRMLQYHGFITAQEREYLNEIYHYNPLLFDYAVKRTVKHPDTGQSFSSNIFTRRLDDL